MESLGIDKNVVVIAIYSHFQQIILPIRVELFSTLGAFLQFLSNNKKEPPEKKLIDLPKIEISVKMYFRDIFHTYLVNHLR